MHIEALQHHSSDKKNLYVEGISKAHVRCEGILSGKGKSMVMKYEF